MTTSRPEHTGAHQVAPPPRPESPQELREEIAHTREELAATVEALAAKADVKTRAKERLTHTKDRARQRFRRAGHKAGDTRDQVQGTMSAMSAKAKETVNTQDTGMMARRGSAVLAGAGIAMAVGALLRQRRLARSRTPRQRAVLTARRSAGGEARRNMPFMGGRGRRGMIAMKGRARMKGRAQRKMIATRAVVPAKALTAGMTLGRGVSAARGRMSATRARVRAARRRAMFVSALGAAMVWLAKRRTAQHEARRDIEREAGRHEVGHTVG